MKFGFVTCVQLGLACIEEIYSAGGELDLAVTLHDDLAVDKSGRVFLDEFCRKRPIDLLKVRHINDAEVIDAIRRHEIDWLFIIGWSQIAGADVLAGPRRGVLGIHPTLLPEGRGRAPIPWAILNDLTQTGVTLFKLDSGVDTGDIVTQQVVPIDEGETATTLYAKLSEAHRSIIRDAWNDLAAGTITLTPQDERKATVWPGRTPEDGRIKANMTVGEAARLVRATTRPYPGAFYDDGGRRIRIWSGRIVADTAKNLPSGFCIDLADGLYEAVEFEIE